MKTNEEKQPENLIDIVLRGEPLVVGEYRGVKVDVRRSVDKTDGKARSNAAVAHLLETGSGNRTTSIIVTEWLDNPDDAEAYTTPWTKGKRYAFLLATLTNEKGHMRGNFARKEVIEV